MQSAFDNTLDFDEVQTDTEPNALTRNHYRVQVRGKTQFFLDFRSACYPLLDISEGGVCVSVARSKSLATDGLLSNCSLVAGNEVFEGLEGRIVHYSLGSDGDWICGVQWLNLEAHARARLARLVKNLREELFTNE